MRATQNSGFERNPELEILLQELNSLLSGAEEQVSASYKEPQFPVIFIVGAARSGTTLLLQWLAQSRFFGYPSNFISRFFKAPYIGAKIQRMLYDTKYAFRNELAVDVPTAARSFESTLGKTSGYLSPHEFWYFWRRFFPYQEIQKLSDEELESIDSQTFLAELAALEAALDKPLAMKALIINWNISYITKILPQAFFLYLRRDVCQNAASLMRSRLAYFGDRDQWYSFKPPEYEDLRHLDAVQQVVGQVVYTNRAVQEGLAGVEATHKLEIAYEELCKNPDDVWRRLTDKMKNLGLEMPGIYPFPVSFNCADKRANDDQEPYQRAFQNLLSPPGSGDDFIGEGRTVFTNHAVPVTEL
jgi:LPS sulfotransferase NodH